MMSQQGRELQFQRHIMEAIATGADLTGVLSDIAAASAHLCRAHMAGIGVLTAERTELEIVGTFGTNTAVLVERLPVVGSLGGLVVTSGRSVRTADVLRDRRPASRELAQRTGARGFLGVPLRDKEGAFGVLVVAKHTPWRFSDRDQTLLQQLADNASIAVQQALRRTPPAAPTTARSASEAPRNGAQPNRAGSSVHHLSPRELEIMTLLAGSKTCKEAAATLQISERTLEHYLERLKQRFRQTRLHALVGYVVKHGLLASLPLSLISSSDLCLLLS